MQLEEGRLGWLDHSIWVEAQFPGQKLLQGRSEASGDHPEGLVGREVVGWQGLVAKPVLKPLWGFRIPHTIERAFESFSQALLLLGQGPVTLHSPPQGACEDRKQNQMW